MKIIPRDYPKLFDVDLFQSKRFQIPPNDINGIEKSQKQISSQLFDREMLSSLLTTYNHSIGNDACAIENCKRLLESNTACVVTGQQLGYMGGPLYTLLKGITCLLLARESGAVPVFWLATEDHDISEVNHTYLLDACGNLKKYRLYFPKNGIPVEDLSLTDHHHQQIQEFLKETGYHQLNVVQNLKSYSMAMIQFLLDWFSGTGMVFIEPKVLRPLAHEFFKVEITSSDTILSTLQQSTDYVKNKGFLAPVTPENGTQIFVKVDGKRTKLVKQGQNFYLGQIQIAFDELLERLEKNVQDFSVNVLARPVFQSLLIPTLAYVAGPTEMRYWSQLKEYHHIHQISMPWVIPRLSATIIPAKDASYLNKIGVSPWDEIPNNWENLFPEGLHSLDKKSKKNAIKKTLYEKNLPKYLLHRLGNLIHPGKRLQERIFNPYNFHSNVRKFLVQPLLDQVDWTDNRHHYCVLEGNEDE